MLKDFMKNDCCLVCQTVIKKDLGWVALLSDEKTDVICEECLGKLQTINGEVCHICGRPFELLDPKFRKGEQCYDCLRWEEDPDYKGILSRNYSIFLYNEFLQDVIARYKYRGDYVLAKIFAEFLRKIIKEIHFDLIIPIPLSEERLFERGFNQSEALIVEAGFVATHVLTRIHSEKQSKKSRSERIHLPEVFHANTSVQGTVVLIDDIYTTGSTLRHAAKALKKEGADTIISVTIARG